MHQNGFSWDRTALVEQRAPCRDVRHADAGSFSERHLAREGVNLIDAADRLLGVRAGRAPIDRAADVDAVSRFEVLDAVADRLDEAGRI